MTKFKQILKNITLFTWYQLGKIKHRLSAISLIKYLIIIGLIGLYVKIVHNISFSLEHCMLFSPTLVKLKYRFTKINPNTITYNGKITYFKKAVLITIDFLTKIFNLLKIIFNHILLITILILYYMSFLIGAFVIILYAYDIIRDLLSPHPLPLPLPLPVR